MIQLYIHIYFFHIFPYRLLQNIEHSSLVCIVGLAEYLFIYMCVCVYVNAKLLIYSSPLVTIALLFYICDSVSVLKIRSFVSFLKDPTYK